MPEVSDIGSFVVLIIMVSKDHHMRDLPLGEGFQNGLHRGLVVHTVFSHNVVSSEDYKVGLLQVQKCLNPSSGVEVSARLLGVQDVLAACAGSISIVDVSKLK